MIFMLCSESSIQWVQMFMTDLSMLSDCLYKYDVQWGLHCNLHKGWQHCGVGHQPHSSGQFGRFGSLYPKLSVLFSYFFFVLPPTSALVFCLVSWFTLEIVWVCYSWCWPGQLSVAPFELFGVTMEARSLKLCITVTSTGLLLFVPFFRNLQ